MTELEKSLRDRNFFILIEEESKKISTIEDFKNFLKEIFAHRKVSVYLFGSRARGDNSGFSDIDIGVYSEEDIKDLLTLIRAVLEESNLPYKVDLNKNPELYEQVKKEGIKWI